MFFAVPSFGGDACCWEKMFVFRLSPRLNSSDTVCRHRCVLVCSSIVRQIEIRKFFHSLRCAEIQLILLRWCVGNNRNCNKWILRFCTRIQTLKTCGFFHSCVAGLRLSQTSKQMTYELALAQAPAQETKKERKSLCCQCHHQLIIFPARQWISWTEQSRKSQASLSQSSSQPNSNNNSIIIYYYDYRVTDMHIYIVVVQRDPHERLCRRKIQRKKKYPTVGARPPPHTLIPFHHKFICDLRMKKQNRAQNSVLFLPSICTPHIRIWMIDIAFMS